MSPRKRTRLMDTSFQRYTYEDRQRVQALYKAYYLQRCAVAHCYFKQGSWVLFSGKVPFLWNNVPNMHNMQVRKRENSRFTHAHVSQQHFTTIYTIGSMLIDPYLLFHRLDLKSYHTFLETVLLDLMLDVPCATPEESTLNMMEYLHFLSGL